MMRLKYSTVAALASEGPANCVGSAGSSADSRGARDFGSSRFMPSSGASSSKCGVTLPMSGKSARHEENYHLRGSYGQDWGRNRAGRSLSRKHTGDEFKHWYKRTRRVHARQHHVGEEYEND